MSKIYASYYGNRKLDRNKYFLVQISGTKPAYFNVDYDFKLLHPGYKLVDDLKAGRISEADYKYHYLGKLFKNSSMIINDMIKLYHSTKKDIVLLCYEKPGDFCHRHIFEEWFNNEIENSRNYKWLKIEGEL